MKLLIILLLLILSKVVNGEWNSAVIKFVVTESPIIYTNRLDLATPTGGKTFCWTENYERVYTTYNGKEMLGFTVWKIKSLCVVSFEKKDGEWVQDICINEEQCHCLNYPRLSSPMWAILTGGEWWIDDTEPLPRKPGYYIP